MQESLEVTCIYWPNNLLTPEWSLWTHKVNKTNTSVPIHCHCLNFLRTTAWWASGQFIEYILGTDTFKSAKFVNLEPSLTCWMFSLHDLIWHQLILVNSTAFLSVYYCKILFDHNQDVFRFDCSVLFCNSLWTCSIQSCQDDSLNLPF